MIGDFFSGAISWILMGIVLAVVMSYMNMQKENAE